MARRLVVDNGWYDTLLRDNIELVTGGLERFTANGIIGADGIAQAYDLVVLGAGFKVSQYLWPVEYVGRSGALLADLWAKDGARAYLTVALPAFPNFFMLYGPNAGVRSGSFHSWMEILSRYICGCIVRMVESGDEAIEVRREVYDTYNTKLDDAMSQMLWESEGGGGGYYVNEFGRSGVNMPWTLGEFYDRVKAPDPDDYILS
jgi:4-hydroxyacetophenone monooxygenase